MTIDLDLNRTAKLKDLVASLEDHGVVVPGIERWRELRELADERHTRNESLSPELPADLLGQTVEQMRTWAESRALHQALRTKPSKLQPSARFNALEAVSNELDPALTAKIRDNTVSIIDQLRPEFDQAADMLRYASDLGVQARDTVATLFHASDEKRNAWTAAKQAAPVLDSIFATRQMLSTVAEVPPTLDFEIGRQARRDVRDMNRPSGFNWTLTVVKPEVVGTVSLEPMNNDAPWERWLALAPHLQLAYPIEEIRDAARFLADTGMTVEQALAVSQAQGETAAAEIAAFNA